MKIFTIHLNVKKIPPIAERGRHVLILLQDVSDHYILGTKKMYPRGIVRFVGGGVEKHETFLQAARRELYEELKISCGLKEPHELVQIIAHLTDHEGKKAYFVTTVYFLELGLRGVLPASDLNGVVRFTDEQFQNLIDHYHQLSTRIDPELHFAWYDYGQLYGFIHEVAWREFQKLLALR